MPMLFNHLKGEISVAKLKDRKVIIEIVDIDDKELERIKESSLDILTEAFIEWHKSEEENDQKDNF